MRSVPDHTAEAPPTLEEAERASHDLPEQIERARQVLSDYREIMTHRADEERREH